MINQIDSPLTNALRQFEATEANLVKAERLLSEAEGMIPTGIVFGGKPDYDTRCRLLKEIERHLPAIDGWKPSLDLMELDDIAQWRFDAAEASMPEMEISLYRAVEKPGRELAEYRFRFDRARRALVRDAVVELINAVEASLKRLDDDLRGLASNEKAAEPVWDALRDQLAQVETLLGSSAARPPGWHNLRRHATFAMVCDFEDIQKRDWPTVKPSLEKTLYGNDEALPVEVSDLAELVAAKPRGPVTAKLKWSNLTDEDFERLILSLISNTPGYENPAWLTQTRAPDRGRDLSVFQVMNDPLLGTKRSRVILQCRHRQSSVAPADVATLREQMELWGEPRVDVLVIVTTGRFTADAVSIIEKHNVSDRALRIEMWPNSHLEALLAKNPALIAEFSLR
jgi:hypothetical protein